MNALKELQSLQRGIDSGTMPADEPLFCIRASDRFAAQLVRLWAGMAIAAETPIWMTDQALKLADEMDKWPVKRTPGRPDTQVGQIPQTAESDNASQTGTRTNRSQTRQRQPAPR